MELEVDCSIDQEMPTSIMTGSDDSQTLSGKANDITTEISMVNLSFSQNRSGYSPLNC